MKESLIHEYQDLLFPIAYNLLKDTAESEDMVQDTILAWLSKDYSHIENPRGYLVRSLINRCLNRIREQKRTEHVEIAPELLAEYLPSLIENKDRLSYTLLRMMERLTPMERAVFLLKEVFGYSHKEIAEILGITETYARQVLARARKHIQAEKVRFEVSTDQHLKLYETFIEVCKGRDLDQLIEILKEDVALYTGKGSQVIEGRWATAKFLITAMEDTDQHSFLHLMWKKGMPLLVLFLWETPHSLSLQFSASGHIEQILIKPKELFPAPFFPACTLLKKSHLQSLQVAS